MSAAADRARAEAEALRRERASLEDTIARRIRIVMDEPDMRRVSARILEIKALQQSALSAALAACDAARVAAGRCRHCGGDLPCLSAFGDVAPGVRHGQERRAPAGKLGKRKAIKR